MRHIATIGMIIFFKILILAQINSHQWHDNDFLFMKGDPVKYSALLLLAALGLSACSSSRISDFPSYKLTVVQGNELDENAVRLLQPGLTREQVQHLIGTPLLRDAFHQNRWDYTFVITRNGVVKQNQTLTIYFDNNGLLTRITGDIPEYLAAEDAAEKSIAQQDAQYQNTIPLNSSAQ